MYAIFMGESHVIDVEWSARGETDRGDPLPRWHGARKLLISDLSQVSTGAARRCISS
jgi:hypothetical protein